MSKELQDLHNTIDKFLALLKTKKEQKGVAYQSFAKEQK